MELLAIPNEQWIFLLRVLESPKVVFKAKLLLYPFDFVKFANGTSKRGVFD